jgi:hypothetical protein
MNDGVRYAGIALASFALSAAIDVVVTDAGLIHAGLVAAVAALAVLAARCYDRPRWAAMAGFVTAVAPPLHIMAAPIAVAAALPLVAFLTLRSPPTLETIAFAAIGAAGSYAVVGLAWQPIGVGAVLGALLRWLRPATPTDGAIHFLRGLAPQGPALGFAIVLAVAASRPSANLIPPDLAILLAFGCLGAFGLASLGGLGLATLWESTHAAQRAGWNALGLVMILVVTAARPHDLASGLGALALVAPAAAVLAGPACARLARAWPVFGRDGWSVPVALLVFEAGLFQAAFGV